MPCDDVSPRVPVPCGYLDLAETISSRSRRATPFREHPRGALRTRLSQGLRIRSPAKQADRDESPKQHIVRESEIRPRPGPPEPSSMKSTRNRAPRFGRACAHLAAPLLIAASLLGSAIPAAALTRESASDGPAGPASSAAAEDDVDQRAVRRTFVVQDFERFAPRTALDMVQQIPGFSIRQGGSDRGLGQADTNVLINGRRISGKSNGPVDALGRVPVGEVVRLEIVDGASLDIGGLSGQVLNVVTHSTGRVTGQFRYAPQWRSEGTSFRWGNGEVSLSGGDDRSEWTLGLESDQQFRHDEGPEAVFDAAGSVLITREERQNREFERPILSGSYSVTTNRERTFNLTGVVQFEDARRRETSRQSSTTDGNRLRLLDEREEELEFELGADYALDFGAGRFKLIALHRSEGGPSRETASFRFDDGRPEAGEEFTREVEELETILRAEYTVAALGGDWQFSLEGARNVLDVESELSELDDLGVLRPVPFPGSSSRVEEDRAETTASYSRPLSARVQLQASLGVETSEIRQSGAAGLTRDFVRPKGFVAFDWRLSDHFDISSKLERVVGQLSFSDFVASVNLTEGEVDVSNVNLVPPQSWLLEVEANRGLGSFGSVTVRASAEDVTDIVDQIPIEGGGQAPGNIDSAERYTISTDLTLLTDPLRWPGGRIDLQLGFGDSEVLDPLLGTPRKVSGTETFEVEMEFRQDFPRSNWASGFRFDHEEQAPDYRLNSVNRRRESFAMASVFLEHKDVLGLTIRGSVSNVLDRRNEFFRTVFVDRQAGIVDFREQRTRSFGTIYTLTFEGSF